MYYKVLETDEMINDLSKISFAAYDYTRDVASGVRFLELYDMTIANMSVYPDGFSGTSIYHRGYEIHILPFGNYNMFFIIEEKKKRIIMLRVLYQKQDWNTILKLENLYHSHGKEI